MKSCAIPFAALRQYLYHWGSFIDIKLDSDFIQVKMRFAVHHSRRPVFIFIIEGITIISIISSTVEIAAR